MYFDMSITEILIVSVSTNISEMLQRKLKSVLIPSMPATERCLNFEKRSDLFGTLF